MYRVCVHGAGGAVFDWQEALAGSGGGMYGLEEGMRGSCGMYWWEEGMEGGKYVLEEAMGCGYVGELCEKAMFGLYECEVKCLTRVSKHWLTLVWASTNASILELCSLSALSMMSAILFLICRSSWCTSLRTFFCSLLVL